MKAGTGENLSSEIYNTHDTDDEKTNLRDYESENSKNSDNTSFHQNHKCEILDKVTNQVKLN